jgi:hypothetical protein
MIFGLQEQMALGVTEAEAEVEVEAELGVVEAANVVGGGAGEKALARIYPRAQIADNAK